MINIKDLETYLDFHTLFMTLVIVIGLRYIMRDEAEIVLSRIY